MLEGRRGAAVGLALFLGIGAFGIWSEISSQHNPASQAPHRAGEHAKPKIQPQSSDEKVALYTEVLAWFTGVLAFVSAIQIAFLYRADQTARITANAAKVSADAVSSQLRAYISMRIKEGMPPRFSRDTGPWSAFDVRNTGQTPAFQMTHWIHSAIATPDFKGPFPDGSRDSISIKTTLAPGTEINIVSAGPSPEPGQADAFARGELAAFVFGEINYIDAFNTPRFHKFRYTYTIADILGGVQGARFCEEGNEAN